tara:strand:- start:4489 stop:5529 length:1041 start_codon:yes stop_codon:yes gene_type:complete
MSNKKDIRELSLKEIIAFCTEHNLPKFRAKQIWEWLWKKRATSFEEITSLPKSFRELLNDSFSIRSIKIHNAERSIDGTIKYSFQLFDKRLIEGVLIPSKKRLTACVSSQVGCSLSCNFCATGTLKLERNLTASEIYEQVFVLNEEAIANFNKPLSNIVYMGMGEPLLNYKAVLNSINLITTKQGLSISPKRITVSTAGIAKMIKMLADDEVKFNLAISLHSASDSKRDILMPLNKRINLEELRDSIRYFYDKTGHRVTYEYILFKELNDSIEDAQELAQFAKVSPCKINLIEYNNVDQLPYIKASNNTTRNFISFLERHNIITNLRRSKGKDIAAACGQLVNKLQ